MPRLKIRTRRACYYARLGIEGAKWYNDLSLELEKSYGEDAELFGMILAITSPNATIQSNLTLAKKAYSQYKQDLPFVGFLGTVCTSLELLRSTVEIFGELSPSVIRGTKIRHFMQAILGDSNAVPIDRWMLRAFHFNSPTPARFREIIAYCRKACKRYGLTPCEFQAAIWCGIKQASEQGLKRTDSLLYILKRDRSRLTLDLQF